MRPVEGPLSRVPPWKRLLKRPLEDRIAAQSRLERRIGVVFAAAGAFVIVFGVVVFVARLGLTGSYFAERCARACASR